MILEILNKYELALAHIVPTSWHNICSFVAIYELWKLTCSSRAFGLVHKVQKAPSETGEMGWYSFNSRRGFMMAIDKKLKIKNSKYDFLFVYRAGWVDVPN